MITDILNRDIKNNDLVVVKPTSRYSSGDLNIGMVIDDKKGTIATSSGKIASYNQYYLIENPSEKELEEKKKIENHLKEVQIAREKRLAEKKAMTKIPKKDLIIGGLYKDDAGEKYIYLGKCKREIKSSYWNSEKGISEGYLHLWFSEYGEPNINIYNTKESKLLKNPKKLVEYLGNNIEIDSRIQKFKSEDLYDKYKYTVVIELLEYKGEDQNGK